MGFVVEDEFVFRADHHDAGEKRVLGVTLAAGRGIEDGEEVLDLIARHPSTARRLARKLAVRFVSETPPRKLVRRLAESWELTGGDLREVLRTLVASPELWAEAARRDKVKTPFELAASALRAIDAEITDAKPLIGWIGRMGQPAYSYSAPTGFPDRGDSWTHVGPLLSRVNFALALGRGRIRGVEVDLAWAIGKHRIESLEEAVEVFFPLLMPGRNGRVTRALIGSAESAKPRSRPRLAAASADSPAGGVGDREADLTARREALRHAAYAAGILIGSPEFQVH